MPTYDYKCKECGHEYEMIRSMSQRNDTSGVWKCPNCNEMTEIERIIKVGQGGFVDPGILKADKNMELSGVGKRLSEMKAAHPYMVWKG